ncbi:hypothetical protein KGA66_06115 [Actinocrinis puniceicyclus]|uniref:Uncharacterized protein n=1 Tax=Actinocrinis puniceicyclus TaxID=977794 RepID=A0A8J7WND6_9ACTN|nr:hypothetical protein [Actinocrinis puniceicyclus]MBS2962614.1 hypothetical protein [Actinocrinis puniceicyclus]
MSSRDVRSLLISNFEGILERHGVRRAYSHACALELIAALTGQGISLVRPAHLHDPVADWRRRPEPGDQETGASRARAALYGIGICQVCRTGQPVTDAGAISEHDFTDEHGNTLTCLGSDADPAPFARTLTGRRHDTDP